MFRNDSSAGSAFADVVVSPGEGVAFQWRNISDAIPNSVQVAGIVAPVWVKLARLGNQFSAYYSTDGATWVQIGGTQYIAMNSTVLAGLAVTAHDNTQSGTATFSGVTIGTAAAPTLAVTGLTASANGSSGASEINLSWTDTNAAGSVSNYLIQRSTDGANFNPIASVAAGTTGFTDNALQASTQYEYQVIAENLGAAGPTSATASATTAASPLPSPWNVASIGNASGTASVSGGSYSISSNGTIGLNTNPWYYVGNSADGFTTIYQSLGTNGQFTAEVTSQTNTSGWAKAGLMVRSSGAVDAVFAGIFITPGQGVLMLARNAAGNAAADPGYDSSYSLTNGPVWLRLTASNGTVTGYVSTDDTNWAQVGQIALDLGLAPVAGLAVDAASSSDSTATFANVALGAVTNQSLVPETPYYLQAEAFSANDGRVSWAAMNDVTSYNVEISTDSGQTWQPAASGGSATTDTYLPDNLTANTTYLFRVQAVNANGVSAYSPAVSMTTGGTASWANYAAEAPGLGPVTSNLETDISLSSTNATVNAPSWQNAMLTQLSGTVDVPQLNANYVIGNFSTATAGDGNFGASGVLLMPSLTGNNLGVNNNYGELASNPNQNDNTPKGTINEIENAPGSNGAVFSQTAAENIDQGGYLLLNSNDYDYQLNGNSLVPAYSQTNLTVADPALQELQINAVNPAADGGTYTLTTTDGLQLWLDNQKATQVTSTYTFDATETETIYVEGTQTGEGSIALHWQAKAGAAAQLLDTVYYNVWQITGAQNVPGNGAYVYTVQLPSAVAADANNWDVASGDRGYIFPSPYSPGTIDVAWNGGPEVATVQYCPIAGFTGDWNVNVVQIQVSAGTVTEPVGKAVPNGASFLVGGYYEDTAPSAIVFTNTVTTYGGGSGGTWGLSQLNIGYMQEDTIITEDGTYANGSTLHSNLDGQTYTDWATYQSGANPGPWADATLTPSNPGIVAGVPGCVAFFQPQSNGQQITLKHADNPSLAVPAAITGVASVTVTNSGAGYTIAPTVVFSGGTASSSSTPTVAPTAIATISRGIVTSVTMLTNGSGYATAPTVSLAGGGGSGATGTANLGTWGLVSTNLYDTFVRYVAAETSDTANGANIRYYAMAYANWQSNYQGTVQNGTFSPSAAQAITGDTTFTSEGSYAVPALVTSTPANMAAGNEIWRQIAAPSPSAMASGIRKLNNRPHDHHLVPADVYPAGTWQAAWNFSTHDAGTDFRDMFGHPFAIVPTVGIFGDWLWYT